MNKKKSQSYRASERGFLELWERVGSVDKIGLVRFWDERTSYLRISGPSDTNVNIFGRELG